MAYHLQVEPHTYVVCFLFISFLEVNNPFPFLNISCVIFLRFLYKYIFDEILVVVIWGVEGCDNRSELSGDGMFGSVSSHTDPQWLFMILLKNSEVLSALWCLYSKFEIETWFFS